VRPHKCQVQGDSRFPTAAGHIIPDTSQDAVGLFGHLGTLLAHVQPAVDQHPQVFFRQAAFQKFPDIAAQLEKLVVKVCHMDAHIPKSQATEEHQNNQQVDQAAKTEVAQVDLNWQHKGELFIAV